MDDKRLEELLRFFVRLNAKNKKAVIRRARDMLDQQNKNAAQLHGRQESDPKIRTSKKDSTP